MKHLTIAILAFTLLSCGGDISREDLLPEASGTHGEVLVLMDDNIWNGPIGEVVQEQLNQDAEGVYLRSEPIFNFFRKPPDQMNHINKLSRLILKVMLDNDSTYKETAMIEREDYFARNQLFVIIKDNDPDRLYNYVRNQFYRCINRFNEFELEQLIAQYKKRPNKNVKEKVEKKFGLSVSIPDNSELRVEKDDFLWVKRDRSKNLIGNQATGTEGGTFWIQQGILFWDAPYTDSSQMTVEGVLQHRDTVLKYNIPGKLKGSYMATEYDPYYSPEGKIINYNGVKTVRIQGLWKHAGNEAAFGGGPFLQHTFLHPTNGRVITICGYIYAPKFDKREYLREIDAMLQTVDMLE